MGVCSELWMWRARARTLSPKMMRNCSPRSPVRSPSQSRTRSILRTCAPPSSERKERETVRNSCSKLTTRWPRTSICGNCCAPSPPCLRKVIHHDFAGLALPDPESGQLRAHAIDLPKDNDSFEEGVIFPLELTFRAIDRAKIRIELSSRDDSQHQSNPRASSGYSG